MNSEMDRINIIGKNYKSVHSQLDMLKLAYYMMYTIVSIQVTFNLVGYLLQVCIVVIVPVQVMLAAKKHTI